MCRQLERLLHPCFIPIQPPSFLSKFMYIFVILYTIFTKKASNYLFQSFSYYILCHPHTPPHRCAFEIGWIHCLKLDQSPRVVWRNASGSSPASPTKKETCFRHVSFTFPLLFFYEIQYSLWIGPGLIAAHRGIFYYWRFLPYSLNRQSPHHLLVGA